MFPGPTPRRILVLATGGTIAGAKVEGARQRYRSGSLSIRTLVDSAAVGAGISVTSEAICSVGSPDIDDAIRRLLVDRIQQAISQAEIDGIVITHGTDTMEETAFLLACVLETDVPVVLTGAVRPSDAPDADGPENLGAAINVAASPQARGQGVLVVLGGEVHAAKAVRKSGLDGFSSAPFKPVAMVNLLDLSLWAQPAGNAKRFDLPPGPLPEVFIIHIHAGLQVGVVEALLGASPRGIVIAGVGNGNAPTPIVQRLRSFARAGGHVVRSSRIPGVRVERNVEIDDDDAGFVSARTIAPAQARLLLQLILAEGSASVARIQAAFDAVARNIAGGVEVE